MLFRNGKVYSQLKKTTKKKKQVHFFGKSSSRQITSNSNKESMYMVSREFSFAALIKIYN